MESILDELARHQHVNWSVILNNVLDNCWIDTDGNYVIPQSLVEEYRRDMNTDYNDLPSTKRMFHEYLAQGIVCKLSEILNSTSSSHVD